MVFEMAFRAVRDEHAHEETVPPQKKGITLQTLHDSHPDPGASLICIIQQKHSCSKVPTSNWCVMCLSNHSSNFQNVKTFMQKPYRQQMTSFQRILRWKAKQTARKFERPTPINPCYDGIKDTIENSNSVQPRIRIRIRRWRGQSVLDWTAGVLYFLLMARCKSLLSLKIVEDVEKLCRKLFEWWTYDKSIKRWN